MPEAVCNKTERGADPRIRHNVSNTVTVMPDQWDEVEDYVFDNRYNFAGISFLAGSGDRDFAQAPMTEVLTGEEIIQKYGAAALFASPLAADAPLSHFRDLWEACDYVLHAEHKHGEASDHRKEWVRRFNKYANNYFEGDLLRASYAIKDVHLLHKWTKIQQNLAPIDFDNTLSKKKFTDIDQMGAIACQGTESCDIIF